MLKRPLGLEVECNKKMNTKKILLTFLLVIVVFILLFFSYTKIFLPKKGNLADSGPKRSYEECLNNFDLKKIDMTDEKFTKDDELGYMLFNSTVIEAFLDNDKGARCQYFQKTGEIKVNSLFLPDLCQSKLQVILTLNSFANKLKQQIPEQDFLNECQTFLLNDSSDFKDNVSEDLRDKTSKVVCQSFYMSYQKGMIVLSDPILYDSDVPNAPTCDCLDAEGKQRVCRNGLCRLAGFFSAVSKDNQSLCPKLTEAVVLPYCNLYFDNQTAKKYEDIFRERYCKVSSN